MRGLGELCEGDRPEQAQPLAINKADLVDESVRKVWSDWFNKNKVQHLYFSAKDEQEKIDEDIEEEENNKKD